MAADAVYDAIKAFLETPANVASLADPITSVVPTFRFENSAGFITPTDASGAPTPWIAVGMSGVVYGQQSMGAARQADNRWDEDGTLWLPVYVASGTGSSRARQLAKLIADLFRGLTMLSGSLEFGDAFIGAGAASEEDGNWYEIPLGIEWRRVEA